MQRDMGQGYTTYLLPAERSKERLPEVRTLEPAPPEEVETVADQVANVEAWLGHPLGPLPGIDD